MKPVKLCLKIDLVSYPARAEGLVNSIRLLVIPKLKIIVCPTIYSSLGLDNSWMDIFLQDISAMEKANYLIQDLNSSHRVYCWYFLRYGYRSWKWNQLPEFKSWIKLIVFTFGLIPFSSSLRPKIWHPINPGSHILAWNQQLINSFSQNGNDNGAITSTINSSKFSPP